MPLYWQIIGIAAAVLAGGFSYYRWQKAVAQRPAFNERQQEAIRSLFAKLSIPPEASQQLQKMTSRVGEIEREIATLRTGDSAHERRLTTIEAVLRTRLRFSK